LGIQNKVCGLLNINGYYDSMIAMADRAVAEGFIRGPHRELLFSDTDVSRLLDRLLG
jgi:predicted Rossmann-fold nucleotide-binding protein